MEDGINQFFKESIITAKGHIKGLITDGNKGEKPVDSVIDCKNMDFYPGYDQKRDPYLQYEDLTSAIGDDTFVNMFIKTFIDGDGLQKEVIILVTRDSGDKVRIFTNWYYYPTDVKYGNAIAVEGGAVGWVNTWTEFTETRSETAVIHDSSIEYYRLDSTIFVDEDEIENKGRGWFVFNDATGKWIGMVLGNTTSRLVITNGGTLTDGDKIKYVRFPVVYNYNWAGVTDVQFEETSNTLLLATGHETRPLWLGFIAEKTFFNDIAGYDVGAGGVFYYPHWDGFWMTYATPIIPDKEKWMGIRAETDKLSFANSASVPFDEDFQGLTTLDFDDLGVKLSILYYLQKIDQYPNNSGTPQHKDQWYHNLWACTVQLDGFQSLFLKYMLGHRSEFYDRVGSVNVRSASNTNLKYQIEFLPCFDRRITGFENFYYKEVNADNVDNVTNWIHNVPLINGTYSIPKTTINCSAPHNFAVDDLITIQVNDDHASNGSGTYLVTDVVSDTVFKVNANIATYIGADSIAWKVISKFKPEDQTIKELYQLSDKNGGSRSAEEKDAFAGTAAVIGLDMNGFIDQKVGVEVGEDGQPNFWRDAQNNGLSLNSFLNQYYYKDVDIKPLKFVDIDGSIIGVNLSKDNIGKDEKTEKSHGFTKIAVSSVQQGNVPCTAVFSEEQVYKITKGEEIVTAVAGPPGQVFIFTKTKMLWKEIQQGEKTILRSIASFDNAGVLSEKGAVSVKINDRFGGIYFCNYDSIYRVIGNETEDLLLGRWKNDYQKLDNEVKEAAICGYYPNRKEVWFYINSKIYIWSIEYEHWKIYVYGDAPAGFVKDNSGELLFNSGDKIFTTVKKGGGPDGEVYLDKGTAGINWYLRKVLNFGTSKLNKIPHGIDLIYESSTTGELPEGGQVFIKPSIKDEAGTDVMPKSGFQTDSQVKIDIVTETYKARRISRFRTRAKWLDIKVESVDDANIEVFKLNELGVMAKLTGVKANKI